MPCATEEELKRYGVPLPGGSSSTNWSIQSQPHFVLLDLSGSSTPPRRVVVTTPITLGSVTIEPMQNPVNATEVDKYQ